MQGTYEITFQPGNWKVMGAVGATVKEIAEDAGISVRGDCGGKGLCGKCRIIADASDNLSTRSGNQQKTISKEAGTHRHALACQTRITGPVSITFAEPSDAGGTSHGKDGIRGRFPVSPITDRFFFRMKSTFDHEAASGSDLSGLVADRIHQDTGRNIFFRESACLHQLSLPENADSHITLVHHASHGVISVLTGRKPNRIGIALDIGTTTIAAYFCDLKNGNVLLGEAVRNPQYRYGEDILSRIDAANQQAPGLHDLRILIVDAVNSLMEKGLQSIGAYPEDIDDVTVVGNTAMEQFFADIHPHGLGRSPYIPTIRKIPDAKAVSLGLDLSPGTHVYFFPVISGFVGGDMLAAILAEGAHHRHETCLIMDIGTNGEIALVSPDGIWTTSCATGPAFEGGQLSCGMRAADGAIYRVRQAGEGDGFHCRTIGDENGVHPAGICGSGIIDAIAVMLASGVILPNGRFNEKKRCVIKDRSGIGKKIILVSGTDTDREIAVTLRDVRQVQLAKAAMAVGIGYLMRKAGVRHVDKTVLTGAFGARFNHENAGAIGMLPEGIMKSRLCSKENLAGVGGIMALQHAGKRAEAEQLPQKIHTVDMASEPDFMDMFAEALPFPAII